MSHVIESFQKKYEFLFLDERCHPQIKNFYISGNTEEAAILASAFIHAWSCDDLPRFTAVQQKFCYAIEAYFDGLSAPKNCPEYNIDAYVICCDKQITKLLSETNT